MSEEDNSIETDSYRFEPTDRLPPPKYGESFLDRAVRSLSKGHLYPKKGPFSDNQMVFSRLETDYDVMRRLHLIRGTVTLSLLIDLNLTGEGLSSSVSHKALIEAICNSIVSSLERDSVRPLLNVQGLNVDPDKEEPPLEIDYHLPKDIIDKLHYLSEGQRGLAWNKAIKAVEEAFSETYNSEVRKLASSEPDEEGNLTRTPSRTVTRKLDIGED